MFCPGTGNFFRRKKKKANKYWTTHFDYRIWCIFRRLAGVSRFSPSLGPRKIVRCGSIRCSWLLRRAPRSRWVQIWKLGCQGPANFEGLVHRCIEADLQIVIDFDWVSTIFRDLQSLALFCFAETSKCFSEGRRKVAYFCSCFRRYLQSACPFRCFSNFLEIP